MAPVLRTDIGVWIVTRHADAMVIQKDSRRFSRAAFAGQYTHLDPEVLQYHLTGRPTMTDGTDHRRLRRLGSVALTPAALKRWQTRIEEIARGVLDEVEPKGSMNATRSSATRSASG